MSLDLRASRFVSEQLLPSIMTSPVVGMRRNSARANVDLPLPVRPTTFEQEKQTAEHAFLFRFNRQASKINKETYSDSFSRLDGQVHLVKHDRSVRGVSSSKILDFDIS